ncbi:hypothetical protein KC218_26610, partial [Mycobacterium tuberculosis]|nr:hypothetical protein [Mycobacterium tuberculosis]
LEAALVKSRALFGVDVEVYRTHVVGGLGREWELSLRLGMRPWIAVAYSAPVAAATAVFLLYPIGLARSKAAHNKLSRR